MRTCHPNRSKRNPVKQPRVDNSTLRRTQNINEGVEQTYSVKWSKKSFYEDLDKGDRVLCYWELVPKISRFSKCASHPALNQPHEPVDLFCHKSGSFLHAYMSESRLDVTDQTLCNVTEYKVDFKNQNKWLTFGAWPSWVDTTLDCWGTSSIWRIISA